MPKKTKWIHGAVAAALLLSGGSRLSAEGGIWARELALTGAQLNNHYETYMFLTSSADSRALAELGLVDVDEPIDVVPALNTGQAGSGRFGDDMFFPPIRGGEDYAVEGRAEVTVPAGTWSIAFGSDDGGQLTLQTKSGSEVIFQSSFNTNGHGNYRLRTRPQNQLWFLGNRGHNWTGGSFTIQEETTAIFHSSFHERGGGDDFEVAIAAGVNTDPQDDGSWLLLRDGAFGWSVQATEELPEIGAGGLPIGPVEGSSLGAIGDGIQQTLVPVAGVDFHTVGDGTEYSSGLHMTWLPHRNRGNLLANLSGLVDTMGSDDTLKFTGSPQWIGNAGAGLLGLEDLVTYPREILEAGGYWDGAAAGNQDGYQVWSSGEIELESGVTKFRLGVDDYKYFAIDVGRNGIAGDQAGEILLDDNTWLNPYAHRGGSDNSNESVVAGVHVEEDGWYQVEVLMNEGEGGDAQTIFWDGNGNADEFPHVVSLNFAEAARDFLVPEEKFRSVVRGPLDEPTPITLRSSFAGQVIHLDISSDLVDADHVVLRHPDFPTELDLAGATIHIHALDEIVPGDGFVLFDADTIVGAEDAIWNYPEGTEENWSNQLAQGSGNRLILTVCAGGGGGCSPCGVLDITALECVSTIEERDAVLAALNMLPGDFDGVKGVDFGDFLLFSVNFGDRTKTAYTDGDINLFGGPDFGDFLVLSANFGQGRGAAVVPEPRAMTGPLLTFAWLWSARRKRRR